MLLHPSVLLDIVLDVVLTDAIVLLPTVLFATLHVSLLGSVVLLILLATLFIVVPLMTIMITAVVLFMLVLRI